MQRLLTLFLLVPLLFACGEQAGTSNTAENTVAATDFTLNDLEGKSRSLSDWDQQVVLVNFWAPWCPPCREEVPDFIELQEKYAAQGFTIVGITVDTQENAQTFADTMGINYPVLIAEDAGIELAKKYGNKVGALPYTAVIDREGNITFRHRNALSYEAAETVIKQHL